MALVQYMTIAGAPGWYFECKPFRATLSTDRCASMWKAKREQCLYCPIGAAHAGAPERMKTVGKCTCSRCHTESSRLMSSGICVSCYNRQREVAAGRMRPITPGRFLRIVATSLIGYWIARTMVAPGDWDDDAEIEAMAGIIARGLKA